MHSQVWYAIPSASVDRCRATLPAWREMGYRVAVLQNRERGEIPADITVWSDAYPGWAASVNILCKQIVPRIAPIIVTGGDDMLPDPTTPAHEIASQFLDRFPHTFAVMQPIGDAFMNTSEYCGSPWLGRAWIDRAYRGLGPMWPGYRHNWADHELKCIADAYGALWQRDDFSQRHDHFSRSAAEPPPYWRKSVEANDQHDAEQFVGRLLTAFPGHEPIGAPSIPPEYWRANYKGPAARYWATRYAEALLAGDAADRLDRTLHELARCGVQRVVIYGAGTELQSASAALRDAPVRIVALADDAMNRAGTRLWGFDVLTLDEAAALEADAVIICTRNTNEAMEHRARSAFPQQICITQLATASTTEHCHA
ncbi:MAG: hypothetical protein H6812_10475 [Phycisphaeraceae bacterium]|nr:hypothetical protein [Phycisphaeraceae bacterium]